MKKNYRIQLIKDGTIIWESFGEFYKRDSSIALTMIKQYLPAGCSYQGIKVA